MDDSIDSSNDIQRQLDELEESELGEMSQIQTGRSKVPKWVLWMIAADVVIGIAVVAVVFAA